MGERVVVMVLFLMLVGGASYVDAAEAEVVVIDEIGSFSGAVLRMKASVDGDLSDKILPSEYLVSVGIVKFEIETSLSEVFLDITVTKDGVVVDNIEEGPFVVDGSEILIDRREGAEEVEVVVNETVDVENESVEVEIIENETINVDVIEGDVYEKSFWSIDVGGNGFVYYLVGGLLTFVVFMVMWFRFEVFREWLIRFNYFSDEGELARIEAKIKRKDGLIARIKKNRARKKKIRLAKKKLVRKNKKLEKMIRDKIKRLKK